jgi:hypothetical protein
MRKNVCAALLFVLCLGTEGLTQDWTPLPKQGFISGRVATPADVAAGNAVFSASGDQNTSHTVQRAVSIGLSFYARLECERLDRSQINASPLKLLNHF